MAGGEGGALIGQEFDLFLSSISIPPQPRAWHGGDAAEADRDFGFRQRAVMGTADVSPGAHRLSGPSLGARLRARRGVVTPPRRTRKVVNASQRQQ